MYFNKLGEIVMVKYKWITRQVEQNLNVRQVYGIVFNSNGNIILRIDDNKYKLTGGKPEVCDRSNEETLKREYLEELNVEIEDIQYIGYLLVKEDKEKYAQVRMIARIKNIGPIRPDADNGKIYQRFMAKQENVKKYLNYKDSAGNEMIDYAIKLANLKYKFNLENEEYYI